MPHESWKNIHQIKLDPRKKYILELMQVKYPNQFVRLFSVFG